MLTRSDILSEAIHKCLVEMYKWAQPAINLDKLIADGYKDSKEDPLYKKHYLSEKNFIYLRDIYKDEALKNTKLDILNLFEKCGIETNDILIRW